MRTDGHKFLRGWCVVVQEEEETVYIPERRILVRLMLHKIVNLRWLQSPW